ncbi:MAG: flap endonuclease-1 [Nanoarchaeota archaeon]|nr:flap endonuclease-1 [Nanoarchaeota archaeon]
MGCAITEILKAEEITLDRLKGKILAVDTMNQLYMFLSSIRGADGSYLADSKGNVTSHLSGLFFRFAKLMGSGLRFAFVFDGKMNELKRKEVERRKNIKIEAQKEFMAAEARQDLEAMKKYAARTTRMTPEMKEEATKLIKLMGMPVIQAPGEGEAQACHLVNKGQAYAVLSQDADALLFGGARVVKNLSITQRRKQTSKLAYQSIMPEIISLKDNLTNLNLSQDELIALGLLVGTDFNVGGIKGLGPKKAMKLIREHKDLNDLFKAAKWKEHFDFPWKKVFDLFKNAPMSEDYELDWKEPDCEGIIQLLVDEHEFSRQRVQDVLDNLKKQDSRQKGLGDFF